LSSNLSSVKRRPFFALSLAVLLLGAAASCGDGGKPPAAGGRLRIAVVPKGTTHEFWKSIRAGAEKAGRELDVEIVWKGPAKEDDRIGQIQVLEDFVAKKVDGLVLAPLDDAALAPVVAEAAAAGVPTVVIDSDLVGDRHVSFVATDNERGGRLAAERLGALMGGKGKALMLRYQEGSASTTAREKGFVDALREKFPGVELVSDNQYGGATAETAYKAAENLLVARKDVDGVFCCNESTTYGMLRALEDVKRAGEVKFVGFDGSPKLAEALRARKIHGLVLQDPVRMGYEGVKAMVAHKRGGKVEKRIDTGAVVATPENADEPAVAALLTPETAAGGR
jgi:ribose transport system substrate-binding protein